MNLGDIIQKLREDNNLSQDAFAESLNVTRQTVSNWENKKNYPDIETLILISDKYNISLDFLLKGDRRVIKDMNKKIKNYKKLLLVIPIIIVVLFALYCISYAFDRIKLYISFNHDDGIYVSKYCYYDNVKYKLVTIVPALDNGKKWYEPFTYDSNATKAKDYMVVMFHSNNTYEIRYDIINQMNFIVDDYENSDELLKAMREYMVSIGFECD